MGCQPQKPTDRSERNRHQNKSLGKTEFPHGRVKNLLFWKGKTYVLPSPCSWRQTVPSSSVAILAVKHRPGIPERDDAERSWAWWKLMRNTNHPHFVVTAPTCIHVTSSEEESFFSCKSPRQPPGSAQDGTTTTTARPLSSCPQDCLGPFPDGPDPCRAMSPVLGWWSSHWNNLFP